MIRGAAVGCCAVLCATLGWSQTNIPAGAVPNAKHYRDSGVGNATGRSGAAVLTARALLGKEGVTTIELTTGTLDSSATPPGSFNHVQFKPFSQAGNPLYTQNSSPGTPTGYYSFTSPSLYRAEQVQLQGNITGIDRNRTDVVTVVETVKLRPDLKLENIQLPSSAMLNQMVNISANVVELNGDAGANAACQLYVDGSLVDSTPQPIWVDAGGSVSCAFTYRFASAGSHTVEVEAANVMPADWDTSNNSATATINIGETVPFQHAYANFTDTNGGFPLVGTDSQETWNGATVIQDFSETYGNPGEQQSSQAGFTNAGCGNYPGFQFPLSVTYAETMDGKPAYAFTDKGITGFSSSGPYSGSLCGSDVASFAEQYGADYQSDHNEYLQSQQYFDASGNVIYSFEQATIQRQAGSVTYYSQGYSCYYWNDPTVGCNNFPQGYYMFNSSTPDTWGTVVPVGSVWTPSVLVQDAAGAGFTGSINVPLTGYPENINIPETCSNSGPDANGYTYQNCSSVNYNYTYTAGSAAN